MKHINTICEFRRFIDLPTPQHPLISVTDVGTVPHSYTGEPTNLLFNFYSMAVKRMHNVKTKYGQPPFDLNEGIMSFMSPNPVCSMAVHNKDEAVKKPGR